MSVEDTRQILNQLAQLRSQLSILESRARQTFVNPPSTGLQKSLTVTIKKTAHGRSVGDPVLVDGSECEFPTSQYLGVVSRVFSVDEIEVTTVGGIVYLPGTAGEVRSLSVSYPYIGPSSPDEDGTFTLSTLTYLTFTSDDEAVVKGDMVDYGNYQPSISYGYAVGSSWLDTSPTTVTAGYYTLVDGDGQPATPDLGIAGAVTGIGVDGKGVLLMRDAAILRYEGSAPAAGDTLYLSTTTPGYVTATVPTTGTIRAVGTALGTVFVPGISATCTKAQLALGAPAKTAASAIVGILPLTKGGTGRDMTANPINGVVYKYDATTLGVTINYSGPGVLYQGSGGIPSFIPSSADNTVLRRVSGGLAWGKVDPANDLSTYVPLAFGGGGRDLTTLNINGVIFKDSSTTLGATINTGALAALVQSSSGVPYFLNFDDGNSIDVSGGNIKAMICQKKSSTTAPSFDGMFLRYFSSTELWGAYRWVQAKGDLAAHDGTDPVRLSVGTNGQVLIADSSQASGLKWGALSVTPYKTRQKFTSSTTFTVPAGVTRIQFCVVGAGGGSGLAYAGANQLAFVASTSGGATTTQMTYTYHGPQNGGSGAISLGEMDVSAGGTISVTVGSAGTNAVSAGDGGLGGSSSISHTFSSTNTIITAEGGKGGVRPDSGTLSQGTPAIGTDTNLSSKNGNVTHICGLTPVTNIPRIDGPVGFAYGGTLSIPIGGISVDGTAYGRSGTGGVVVLWLNN